VTLREYKSILPLGSLNLLTVALPSYEDIVTVMFDQEGVKRKADDSTRVCLVFKRNYYGVYLNGSIISLGCTFKHSTFGQLSSPAWISHFDILQSHKHMAHDCLRLILEIIPHQRPLYADIPDLYRPFQNFVKKFGFYDSGKIPGKFFIKNKVNYAYRRMILD